MWIPWALSIGWLLIVLATMARALLRPHRTPASRIVWVVVILVIPGLGVIAYLLVGETNIGSKRAARSRYVLNSLPSAFPQDASDDQRLNPEYPERCGPLFRLGETINGFRPVGGNSAYLTADSNAAIDAMVADMDAAEDHIHLIFYIWLSDNNGVKVVEALKRAAARGVHCRAMADALGSRAMIRSPYWTAMRDAGVRVGVALPIGNPLRRVLKGRIDLRNHRKTVVIDNWITYCGSQNCADPEFRVKPRYAPCG